MNIQQTTARPVVKGLNLAARLSILVGSLIMSLNASGQTCTMDEVMIVNLSQDAVDIATGNTCVSRLNPGSIESCIADEIEAALPSDCDKRFDVYVPGTNQEHGAWKQFNHIFRSNTNRAKLSLRYEDVRTIEDDIGLLDPAKYDRGVADARASLIHLLNALEERFIPVEVRVFGHSKGSHSVALVAPLYENAAHMAFYAFAQPGRTDRDIESFSATPRRGRLGREGYIEKLSTNLVGINFSNDEVRLYRGDDGAAPAVLPERWDFPGFIWQDDAGASPIGRYRIDHHNNYGGDYTDGGNSENAWRDGQGTVGDTYPYCATGSAAAWGENECDETRVRLRPHFWGSPACEAQAYRMMALGAVGERYAIGYSGPREPGTCHQANLFVEADYEIYIRWNLPDQNCRFDIDVAFEDLASGKETDRFSYEGSVDNENEWFSESGTVIVPIHMQLKLKGELIDRNNDGLFPDCESAFESEAYINYLTLSFTHPSSGEQITRTIMGLDEGAFNPTVLDGDNDIAWEQPDRSSEDLNLYSSTLGTGVSLKIEGPTDEGHEGNFQKRVHLIE